MSASERRSWLPWLAVGVALVLALAAPAPSRAQQRAPHRGSVAEQLDCGACHTPDSWKSMSTAAGGTGFDHDRTGFPLTRRHAQVPCAGCHRSDRAITRQCAGCHEDAHAGQLGASCDGCHSAAGWQQTAAFQRHRQTRLPLTGMHALADCRDCHRSTTENTWSRVPADCFACHAADYQRPDIHPLHVGVPGDPEQPPFPRDCGQCHRASGWLPAFVTGALASTVQALSTSTGHDRAFPLSYGPHRGADCQSCHVSASSPRAVRCDGCHAHDELKLREQHRTVAAFGASCLGCHPGGRAR